MLHSEALSAPVYWTTNTLPDHTHPCWPLPTLKAAVPASFIKISKPHQNQQASSKLQLHTHIPNAHSTCREGTANCAPAVAAQHTTLPQPGIPQSWLHNLARQDTRRYGTCKPSAVRLGRSWPMPFHQTQPERMAHLSNVAPVKQFGTSRHAPVCRHVTMYKHV
jgi:hypothetical protein